MTQVFSPQDFYNEDRNHDYRYKILVEGDSWVSHPFVRNLSSQINHYNVDDNLILNLAIPGDEAAAIFKPGGRQMKTLKRLIADPQWNEDFDIILLSAAGNDIVGPEISKKKYVFDKHVHPDKYGRMLISAKYGNMVDRVVDGYRRFLDFVQASPLSDIPVITHVYSYLQPRRKGTRLGPIMFNQGWIAKYLEDDLHIDDKKEQYDILKGMLDTFHDRVIPLQEEFDNFLVVDTRRVLLKGNGTPRMSLWHDEIHPNKRGFKAVMDHIRDESRNNGMWPLV